MRLPRVLFCACSSGSGKTLITCGFLQALKNRGIEAASFKCGPDYIDPMFHERVIGTRASNLDTFFAPPQTVRYLLAENAKGCDLAVIEGVMGYYDGVGGVTHRASAYDVSCVTDTPAILLVNSAGMSGSLAACIKGFLEYEKDSRIRGVIFNQMSPMLYPRMRALVEERTGVRVLGYVPKLKDCVLESRHLGLVMPQEVPALLEKLDDLAHTLEETLDIDGILELAGKAPELPEESDPIKEAYAQREKALRIGVASDAAFCFFYKDNFRLLRRMGAELITFSPLSDQSLPEDIDGLLLCGGYPELHAKRLEENSSMRKSIRNAIAGGMPCMAECGGFLYLHEEMEDMEGKSHAMAGVIEGRAFKTDRLSRFGYITLKGNQDDRFGEIPAHEFHYFDSTSCGTAFHAQKPESSRGWDCIHDEKRLFAGFPHLYYYGNPAVPEEFLHHCLCYQKERSGREV